jgi:20S proteasome alpha/beta subunit
MYEGEYIYEFGDNFRIDFTRIKNENVPSYTLRFDNIDLISKKAAKGLRKFVDNLYNSISELHYNVETIITGVDKENKSLNPKSIKVELDGYYKKVEGNLRDISNNVSEVKDKIVGNINKKYNK